MTQLIITYIIIFAAIAYALFAVIKSLRVKSSGSCGDDCGCSAKDDIKKAMSKKRNAALKASLN